MFPKRQQYSLYAILVKYLSKYIYGFKHWKTFRWGIFYILFLTLQFFQAMWRNTVNFFCIRDFNLWKKTDAWWRPFKCIRDPANSRNWKYLKRETIVLNKYNSSRNHGRFQISLSVYEKLQQFPKRDQTQFKEILPPVIYRLRYTKCNHQHNRHTTFKLQVHWIHFSKEHFHLILKMSNLFFKCLSFLRTTATVMNILNQDQWQSWFIWAFLLLRELNWEKIRHSRTVYVCISKVILGYFTESLFQYPTRDRNFCSFIFFGFPSFSYHLWLCCYWAVRH